MILMTACLGPVVLPTLSLAQGYRPQPAPSTKPTAPAVPGTTPAAPAPGTSATPPGAVVVPIAGGDVTVVADRLEEVGPDKLLVATGNVEITHGAARLIADRVEMNRDTGDAVAQGRVVFYDGENQLTGRRIDYNLKTGTGVVYYGRGPDHALLPHQRRADGSGGRERLRGATRASSRPARTTRRPGRSASARPPPTWKTSCTAPAPRSG